MSKTSTSVSPVNGRFHWFLRSVFQFSVLALTLLLFGTTSQAQVILSESFDGATFPPTGWTVNGTGNNANIPGQTSWVRVPGGTTTATPPYDNSAGPHSGAGMAFYNAWDIDAGGVSNLITPAINFASPAGAKVISFWLYRNSGQSAADSLVVLINSTASATGATRLFGVAPSANVSTSQWQQYTVNVPASFSGTSQYIIFKAQSAYQTDIFLDDVTVTNLTACTGAPTVSLTSSVTSTCPNVPFTLTATTGPLSGYTYQFESSTNGGATWSNLGTASSAATRTVASQTSATQYRVTVTCASGGTTTSASVLVGQNPQNLCYCVPSGSNANYYIDGVSTTGGTTNISNLGTGYSAGGYADYTSQSVTQVQTMSVSFTIDHSTYSNFGTGIWVDWNQDGDFTDAGEKVFTSTAYQYTETGSFQVPITALAGPTRMRIGNSYTPSSGPSGPCLTGHNGEFEDYTFNVIALTPCAGAPSASISSSTTSACPNLPFTLTAMPNTFSGLTYQFQSSTNGGATWTNIGTTSAANTRTITSQTVATQYRVYVICNTGGTDTSAPVSVAQTPSNGCYCIPSGSSSTYYINSFSTTGAISNITNTGTGYQPAGYGQFQSQVVAQLSGQDVNFSSQFGPSGYTYGFAIWVDWNQNGVLTDPGEKVFSTSSYSNSHSGTFTVPTTALTGPTRMRIGNSYTPSTGPSGPCVTGISGEFEDYTFQVVPLTPCSGPPTVGAIVSNIAIPCVGDSITLSIPGASFDTGIVFRWEYQDAITGSVWSERGINNSRVYGDRPTSNTDYRVIAKCRLTGDSTISATFTITPLAAGLPYFEDFESITSNNQLPPCMKATDLGTTNLTYISNQTTYNRRNHTPGGSKFAAFKYNNNREDYFFTPGLPLQGNLTYEISYWYATDGNGIDVNNRTTIGTGALVDSIKYTLGVIHTTTDTAYKQVVYRFKPDADGTYFIGIGNLSTSPTNATGYLSIDDISVKVLPPCTGTPNPGTIVSTTVVNCPGSQVELSVTGQTAASYLTYQWLLNGSPVGGALGMSTTYLTAPLTTAIQTYTLEVTCTSSSTGVNSDTTAPFVITPYTVTVPYQETFESITRNSDLPTCFTVTDLALGTNTYFSGGPGSNHTPSGSKYAVFQGTSLNEWMFTPMMTLQGGMTYRFSFWYRTSTSTPYPVLQATVGTAPNQAQHTTLLDAIPNAGTTTYKEFITIYTPATTGDYSFGINATTSSTATNVMSIDDIGVIELPPCSGMPSVAVNPTGTIYLCPTDSFSIKSPLPAFSGLAYQWERSPDPNFLPTPFNAPGNSTTNNYTNAAPQITHYYRLRVTCNNTGDVFYSDTVKVDVNTTKFAPLPYVSDLETWENNCANHDVPTDSNWLQPVKSGNSSWRRYDEGATAGWTNPNTGAFTPPARSGTGSARFHSSQAAVTTTPNSPAEGQLDMYVNCDTGPGSSDNKTLYFYHISPGTPTNALDVRLSTNGGVTWTTLASYDSAFDWRLRRIPFVSDNAATIIRFAGRHTATAAGSDIGIDSIFVAPPCTGQPVAGTLGAISPLQICPGDAALVNLNGTSMAGDLRIDWEVSTTGPTGPYISRTTGPNGGGYDFNSGQLMQSTWIRAKVTCGGSTLSSYSDTLAFTVNVTPPTVYAALPYTQNFESWTDRCGLQEIPSANWANVPAFGNNSWRRDDQGSTAAWSNLLGGQWWPASPRAAIDSFSARFHNSAARPSGSRGALNLYVDCSANNDPKELRFFVNMSDRTASNTDSLRIRYSTDGGLTFTRLDSIRGTRGWEQRIYSIPSNSTQTIIRFEAVSDTAQKDIGLDYVQVLEECSGTPVAGTVDSVAKMCAGRSFRLSTSGTSQQGALTFVWERSTTSATTGFTPVTNGTGPFLTTSITQNTWFRLGVSCGTTGTVVYTPARLVELGDTFYCYCVTGAQYPSVTSQYKENIGRVALKNSAGATMMSNGLGAPINNNNTAINAYTNFQNQTPTPLYRDSTYGLEVQQISYSSNSNAKVVAWIDYNRDGVFDASERVVNLTTNNTSSPAYRASGNFTVPANAKPGITGMRITLQQPGSSVAPDPCGTYNGYGETEDYLVELRFAPCSGFTTLDGGTAYISETIICPGYPVTLWDTSYQKEVYGVIRQWQQSVNNGVSWQPIGTPNTDTIDAIVQVPTQYRYAMGCNNGVESYSNVVSVNLLPATACYCPSYANGGPTGKKDSSDIGSVSLGNGTFQVGGPHLLNPMATKKWTNYAAAGAYIELWADSTYDMDVYHIMRGTNHKDAKVTVFIDYNQNLAFDINPPAGYPSERVLTAYTSASNYYLDNMQLRIPSQQVLPNGATLMRVILNEDTGPSIASDEGCGTYESGETEDYFVVFRCPTCPTGVDDPSGDNISMFSLFPNPTTGIATVKLATRTAVKEIEMTITNMTGQVMKKETFKQPGTQFSATVDLNDQPRGVYFVELKADNERIVRKLTVQ